MLSPNSRLRAALGLTQVPFICILFASRALAYPKSSVEQPAPPAVLIEGERLEWVDLHAPLAEAAGGAVLEEAVLARLLAAECRSLGIAIDDRALEAEHDRLSRTLAAAAGLPANEGETLVERVRASRGLGPTRFPALLQRNAMLRALVRAGKGEDGPITVSEADVRQAYALKYGPKVRVRLILVRSMPAADTLMRRIRPDYGPGESFGDLAAQFSVDPSSERGGLIDPFSLDDANYPFALRRAISALQPGEVSEPVLVSAEGGSPENGRLQGYALIKLEELIPPPPGTPSEAEAAAALREEVQMVRERAMMDKLARRLVRHARVTIFDRSLDKSWKQVLGEP